MFCAGTILLTAGLRAESFDLPLEPDYNRGVAAYPKKDYGAALQEFAALAEESHPQAQYYLSTMYHKGKGVPRDDFQAHIWATIATGINRKRAAELRGEPLKTLTSKQKKKARKVLQEWEKAHAGK